MSCLLKALPVVVSVVEFTLGMFGNGFIVLTNGIAWIRTRKLSLIDMILTGLAVSQVCFLCVTMSAAPLHIPHESMFRSKSLVVSFDILWTGSNYLCLACNTCLSVFYFFRIASFSSPAFLWVRWRIRSLLRVIVLAAVISYFVFLIFVERLGNNLTQGWAQTEKNMTLSVTENISNFIIHHILFNVTLVFFFVVSLVSLLLLILSLGRHSGRMEGLGLRPGDLSTKAHVKALKTMISFLALFIVHCVAEAMIVACSLFDSAVTNSFARVLIFFNPSVHPFLLILWNSRLKQALLCVVKMLRGEITTRFYRQS
ncbi:taste receptor type 2 member 7-like [Dipodomys spectabilis]|uniref:taste receptor type 2 member 7-like n=1 Tax=Dipodomys spectabilis TaxID=105255 RepID=UPI001C54BF96|nr:taste receptor type 2 member 7-like [Dipodomys spectabilis]